jgi:hypothetical protein
MAIKLVGVTSACIPLLLKRDSHDAYAPLLCKIDPPEADPWALARLRRVIYCF